MIKSQPIWNIAVILNGESTISCSRVTNKSTQNVKVILKYYYCNSSVVYVRLKTNDALKTNDISQSSVRGRCT